MRVLGVAVASAVLAIGLAGSAGPARAQSPHINLLSDGPSKTPDELEAEAARDKAYKESLKKIPDAKTASDPWGTVRSGDAPKAAAGPKSASPKPKTEARTRTGNSAN
jgi:hypothetical protein